MSTQNTENTQTERKHHHHHHRNHKKRFKWHLLAWAVLAVLTAVFYFVATHFIAFPSRYKMPLLYACLAIVLITGLFSYLAKKTTGRTIIGIVNIILSICLIIGSFFLPNLEERMKSIFRDINVNEIEVNVYAFTSEYKTNHPEVVLNGHAITPSALSEYDKKNLILQTLLDQENQKYALEQMQEQFPDGSITILEKEDLISAAEAFYKGEAELLVLNKAYVSSLEDIEGFSNFSNDTMVIYSAKKEAEPVIVEKPAEIGTDITNTPFTVYIAGSDTRSSELSTYGRTDVDILLTVNPNTKQMMVTGIPRDSYIPNPALGYGNDKLTHLGNNGVYNTMQGISEYFQIPINNYLIVNFVTFKNIIDAIGGINIYNPYYFTTVGGNGGGYSTQDYDFPEGDITLNGDSALAYVRERYNLEMGDYGRSEHQTIVLKGILQKLTASTVISNYDSLLSALNGQFLTDMNPEDIYKLAVMQVDDGSDWDIIVYHLGGQGAMQGTASMGWDRMLYTVNLFDSQKWFINDQTNILLNGEEISQMDLPDMGDTTYIPN